MRLVRAPLQRYAVILSTVIMASAFYGCAWNLHPIDVQQVQEGVVKGTTTLKDIEKTYGKPFDTGKSTDGTSFYYYLSANPLTGSSQHFTFYFDKNEKVVRYATECPASCRLPNSSRK